jgi:regulatory protein
MPLIATKFVLMNKKPSLTVHEALLKLMQYCTYQDRCHKEVEKKLDELGMYHDAKAHIISKLIEDNFLNEERFAKSFARGKFRIKKWGKIRITRELKLRQISTYNLNTALKEISEDDYLKTLNELVDYKYKQLGQKLTQANKQKIYQYLAYRGFENHLIYEAINNLKT